MIGIESPVGSSIPGRLGPRSALRMLPAGTGQGSLFDTSSSPSTALLNAVSSESPSSMRFEYFIIFSLFYIIVIMLNIYFLEDHMTSLHLLCPLLHPSA